MDSREPLTDAALPDRVVVGRNGAYWRDYGDGYSMCPVSDDNDPVEPVAVYVPEQRLRECEDSFAVVEAAATEAQDQARAASKQVAALREQVAHYTAGCWCLNRPWCVPHGWAGTDPDVERGICADHDHFAAPAPSPAREPLDVAADLQTLKRSLPKIVGPGTAELWLAFGRIERALERGPYARLSDNP